MLIIETQYIIKLTEYFVECKNKLMIQIYILLTSKSNQITNRNNGMGLGPSCGACLLGFDKGSRNLGYLLPSFFCFCFFSCFIRLTFILLNYKILISSFTWLFLLKKRDMWFELMIIELIKKNILSIDPTQFFILNFNVKLNDVRAKKINMQFGI